MFFFLIVTTSQANSDTTQRIIWAFGTQNPGSSSVSASIQIHLDSGTSSLDLTKAITSSDGGLNPASGNNGAGSGSVSTPLLPYQRLIVAHALILTVAFLLFLPLGALVARWLRTTTPSWFRAHAILQAFVAGPLILVGLILGVVSADQSGSEHQGSTHKRWGAALVVLYIVQVLLGVFIHYVKPSATAMTARRQGKLSAPFVRPGKRPAQNYFHAVLGLAIIAISFYQVRTGYDTEWVNATGREELPNAVDVVWYLWIIVSLP